MNKVKELKIDSTLWATPAKLVNLIDFESKKISIETENNTNNNIKVHNIRYENGGFYLTINNLRGYFNFNNNNSYDMSLKAVSIKNVAIINHN